MGIINRIIKKQPNIIKRVYYNAVPFRNRYGRLFGETLDFLKDVDNWSYDRAKDYQFQELKKLLLHCKQNVPFYSKLFADYEFDVNISSFDDMKKLPILNKSIINKNFDDLLATNFNGEKVLFRTSGSTGERMKFYGEDSMFKKEAAYILHSYQSHGGNLYDDWSVWIRRHSPKDENDLIVKDYELKRIYLSAFHLNDEYIHKYVDLINKTKTTTIVTYPSTAFWLACMVENAESIARNAAAAEAATRAAENVALFDQARIEALPVNPFTNHPIVEDQSLSSNLEDGEITITLTGSDPDSLPLTFEIVDSFANGTTSVLDNVVTFEPSSAGTHTLTFKASNGTKVSPVGIITATVTQLSPTSYSQSISIPVNSTASITLTGEDPNNIPLTHSVVESTQHGDLTIDDNLCTYTPFADYVGSDSFTFTSSNGTYTSDVVTITIEVLGE